MIALVWTLLAEWLVVFVWCRVDRFRDPFGLFLLVTGMNCVSHPLGWLACFSLGLPVWMAEVAIVLFEALVLNRAAGLSFGKSLLLSCLMNAASITVGWMLAPLVGQ